MQLDLSKNGSFHVMRPKGILSGADAEAFERAAMKLLEHGPVDLVIDLAGVVMVDSRGLEAMAAVAERVIRDGRIVKLAGSNPLLAEVLDLTELASLFQACPTVEAAVGA